MAVNPADTDQSDKASSTRPKMPEQAMRQLLIKQYLAGGRIPWSPGYRVYRENLITEALANSDLRAKLRQALPLPASYGVGLDERCVEYPWIFAQLTAQPERILDAGSALNYEHLLNQSVWRNKQLHILTLAPEPRCYWKRGISYLFDDLRDIPSRDNYYDVIICISTLEHIGLDNRQFTGQQISNEQALQDFTIAMHEMQRVLKPGGHLLLTVPFGRYKNIGSQQVFDKNLLQQAITAFAPEETTRTFFIYRKSGWQLAAMAECQESEYVDWIMLPKRSRPPKFPVQPDGAAAARAVACLNLKKDKIYEHNCFNQRDHTCLQRRAIPGGGH